MKKQTEYCTT